MSDPEIPAVCRPGQRAKVCRNVLTRLQGSLSSLRSLQNRNPHIPLSLEATKEAILMRRAAGEAVFCEAVVEHVFRPILVPNDFRQAAEDMLDFFQDETELQRMFRHLVNKSLGDAGFRAASAATYTTDTIFTSLARFVAPARIDAFRCKVDEFSSQAAQVWVSEAQTAEDVVEVTMPEAKDEHLGTYPEYGVRQNGKVGAANHDVAAALFPRITINGRLLHPGTVLWSDSPAIMIAKDQIPSAAMERAATQRRSGRRNSMAGR